MKKLTIISMAALLLLAASCKKEKKTEAGGDAVFRATTETHSGDSKTQLVNKAVIWNSGDAIKVFNASGTPCEFTAVSEEGSSTTSFGGTAPDDFFESSSYTAFYPSSEDVKLDEEGSYKITLPDTQTYAANSFGPGANPMAAVSTTTELSFKNICGLLKLQLYAIGEERTVGSITLKSNASDEKLWGTGTVDLANPSVPTLGTLDGGSTLTLDCSGYNNGEGVPLGISESSPTVFYFVVPSGTLSGGFTVTVTDTDGKPILIKFAKAASGNTIQRSKITAMPAQPVAPIGALPGVFSISSSRQVFFSKGNLYYDTKMKFENNQYDFRTYGTTPETSYRCINGTYAERGENVGWGLFGWSTETDRDWGMSTGSASYAALKDWGTHPDLPCHTADPSIWHTLKSGEWNYLLTGSRKGTVDGIQKNANQLRGHANITVNGGVAVNGLILLPDNFTLPAGLSFVSDYDASSIHFANNSYTKEQWALMENAGAVFLPAASNRSGSTVYSYGEATYGGNDYWTSTINGNMMSYIHFLDGSMDNKSGNSPTKGSAVRLVCY